MNKYIKTEIIENYMKENNLSKTAFCKKCSVSVETLNRIFSGKNFRLSALFKIAMFLEIHIKELFYK